MLSRRPLKWPLLFLISTLQMSSLHAQKNTPADAPASTQTPSLELFGFLAEWGAVDDETFNLIEQHGLQDGSSPDRSDPDKSQQKDPNFQNSGELR
ncbi:MAG: hypothetical protein ACI8P9_005411 [Parasphingorhabdus sp.]|jgi:hypothetical protein